MVRNELELKLEFPPGSSPALARVPKLLGSELASPKRIEELEAVYFDTPQEKLRRRGVSLRVRRNGKQRLQTIKWLKRSALFERGECETEIDGEGPDWNAARGTGLEPLASKKLRRALKPLFKTKVRRTIYPVATDEAEIELAIDHGSIEADGRSEPIRELELELKRGEGSELFRVARELSKTIPVRLSLKSKAERGYELLNGGAPVSVKAAAIALVAGTSVTEAFRIIARSCLAQIVSNEAGVEAKHPEAVHQMRIGLRRLRGAIAFFSDVAAAPDTERMKSELKWITQELGAARDLDVYASQVLARFREQYKDHTEFDGLCRAFARQRAHAFDRAAQAVGSEHYRNLSLDLAGWIEAGEWASAAGKSAAKSSDLPIETFAARELARRRNKIMKKIEAFAKLDAAQRHKLRIAAKKFRYAAEFVAGVFPRKKSKRRRGALLDAVKRVQDCLGALNDIAVHETLTLGVLDQHADGSPKQRRDRAFVAGLVTGQQQARAARLAEGAAAALADLRAVRPFWK